MHPTTRLPRRLAWALLIAASLALWGAPAHAQPEKGPPPLDLEAGARTEVIGVGQTRKLQMNTKALIGQFESDNPGLVRFDQAPKEPNAVFITGLAPGRALVTLTDVNKKVERIIVVVDETELKRQQLLEIAKAIAPTATIKVHVARNTVIITGDVVDIDSAQRIMEAARGVFSLTPAGGQPAGGAPSGGRPPEINIVNAMRLVGVQQVQLEVVLAVVNRSKLRTMNFNFVVNGTKYVFNSVLGGPFSFANTLATGVTGGSGTLASNPNITFGVFGNKDSFTGYLNALTTEGLAKILTDTRVVTASGKNAFIHSGGDVPILTSSGQGAPSVSYKPFGSLVNFQPEVLGNGKINLQIRPELSAINQANGITIPGVVPTVIPGFSTRNAQVEVQLEDGQTFAIGGLIQNTVNSTIQRVPVLGHLPFFGAAFRSTSYNELEEELLILVTPRLVDGFSCTEFPKYLPGRETRSPDDFELFLEGIMEAPRGPRTVTGLRGYQGAHMLSPNIGQIPCGASTGTGGWAKPGCVGGQCAVAPVTPAPAPLLAMPLPKDALPPIVPQVVPAQGLQPLPALPLPTGTPIPEPDGIVPVRDHADPVLAVPAPAAAPQSLEPRPTLPPVNFIPSGSEAR